MSPSTPTNPPASSKRTRSSASSTTTPASVKQGKLVFSSLKRSESTPSSGRKGKSRRDAQLAVLHPDPVDGGSSSDSSDEAEIEEGDVLCITSSVGGERVMKGRAGATKDVNARTVEDTTQRERLNVKDKRWNLAYGQAKAKMGHAAALHHEVNKISKVDDILRVFDMSYEYGPCVGVTRLERWERADDMGLNPPPEIREILLTKEGSENNRFAQSVLHGEV